MRNRLVAIAAASALAVGAAACSGGDEEQAAPSTAGPIPTVVDPALVPEIADEVTIPIPGPLEGQTLTITETIAGDPQFSTLASVLASTDLGVQLDGVGPFTVIAPTDEAFAALPPGTLDKLLLPEHREALVQLLNHHVVPFYVTTADVPAGLVTTVQGDPIEVIRDGSTLRITPATVVGTDVLASNGVVLAVDAVLVPQSLDLAAL